MSLLDKSIFYIVNFRQPKLNKEYIHIPILSPVKFHLHSLGTIRLQRGFSVYLFSQIVDISPK